MTAGDAMRPFYEKARALYPIFAPEPFVEPDFSYNAPGSGDTPDAYTGGVDANHQLHIACRFDYPSAAGDTWWRDLERENTFSHEIGGHGLYNYLRHYEPNLDWAQMYWQFRGFPGTSAAHTAANMPYVWANDPNESWAETGGAALSGTWTKPEKTNNFGKPADPLAARAFFTECVYQARPDLRPAPSQIGVPMIEWLGPVPISNRLLGRNGNPTSLIVDHWMAAPFASALARFMDSTSGLSAHYLISQTGRIVQVVRDEDTAYHAGDWDVNTMSIGIEHEASPTVVPSDALYAASAWLHADLAKRHNLDLTVGVTVIPHRQVVATACPGTLDLDHIVALARLEDDMFTDADREMLKRVRDQLNAEGPRIWTQRLQDWLSRVVKSLWPNADTKGPDVTTGQPRT